MEAALGVMSADEREHFKTVCAALLSCYIDHGLHALVIIGNDDPERHDSLELSQLLSVNTSEIQAAQLLSAAQTQVSILVMADAPPRSLFS